MRALGTLVLLLALIGGPTLVSPAPPASAAPASAAVRGATFEQRVLVEINAVRTRAGLKRLRFDSCLQRLAGTWSERLAEVGDLVHRDQQQVIRRCRRTWVGENLVAGVRITPKGIVKAWLNSPGHRAIMLKPRARRAGIGVAIDGHGRRFGVLNVASRRRP